MSRTYRNRRRSFLNYFKPFAPESHFYKNNEYEQIKMLSQYYKDGRREHICKCDHCLNLVYRLQLEGKAKKEIDRLVEEHYDNNTEDEDLL